MADIHLVGASYSSRPLRLWRRHLDGAWYAFRLCWNSRAHRWILDVSNAAGASVADGLGVVEGLDLLGYVSTETRPPGQLYVSDDSGAGRIPTRNGWGADFRMLYRPEADVVAASGTPAEIR